MTRIEQIKDFAWEQSEIGEGEVGFDYFDQFIINPWLDPSGRFELSEEQAVSLYGEDNVEKYIHDAIAKINRFPGEEK